MTWRSERGSCLGRLGEPLVPSAAPAWDAAGPGTAAALARDVPGLWLNIHDGHARKKLSGGGSVAPGQRGRLAPRAPPPAFCALRPLPARPASGQRL